jgi:AAA+ ATPase superfamily predicted ATPase
MGASKPENPFSATTYYGAEYFCDRVSETEQLISNMVNGNSTTVIAIRRIGKTGLIQHTLSQLPENY